MPPELDNQAPEMDPTATPDSPEMDAGADMGSDPAAMGDEGPTGAGDQEGAMAKAELIKLANYATNLQEHIQDDEELEAWVQQKITIAATNIASVYHYLAYEKKIGEYGEQLNSPELSEGKKRVLKNWLMEAKSKVKALKKLDAEKKKVMEGPLRGGEQPCGECGGTGVVHLPGIQPHPTALAKVEKYKRLVNATKAAHKRMDGQMSPESDVDESFDEKSKVGDTKKTRTGVMTKTDTGVKHTNTSYHDDGEAEEKSGKGIKTHAKAKDAATKKAERGNDIKLPKHTGNTWGMKNGEKFGKKMEEAKKEKKAGKDYDGDGKIESGKDEVWGSRAKAAAKAGKPFNEDVQSQLDMLMKAYNDAKAKGDQKAMTQFAADYQKLKSQSDTATVKEAKPSAGLSKAKKSAVVKDAKAGKDIGKPGKSFDKVAKAAGGGKKGEKIAAAAMWKNIKETTAYMEEKKKSAEPEGNVSSKRFETDSQRVSRLAKEKMQEKKKETVKESTEFTRMRELTGRLNRAEKPALVENREVDQIRALTKRLLG